MSTAAPLSPPHDYLARKAGLKVLDHDKVLEQLIAVAIEAAGQRGAELAEEAKAPSLAEGASLH